MSEDKKLDDILKERLASLPLPVRDAIKSANVEKGLRGLADRHKLHLDQWQTLENEVMLTLIGLQPIDKLEENIVSEVGVDAEMARTLASDIAIIVFEPIREELERELGKPADEPAEDSPVDSGQLTVNREKSSISPAPATSYKLQATSSPLQTPAQTKIENIPPRPMEVEIAPPTPSTPPAPAPTQKSVRATLSSAYAPDTKSHERKAIDDDPYRESIA